MKGNSLGELMPGLSGSRERVMPGYQVMMVMAVLFLLLEVLL